MTTSEIPGLYAADDAATYLGIDASLVRRYCRQGRIPAKRVGNVWVMRKTALDDFKRKPRPFGNPTFHRKKQPQKKS